MNKIGRRVYYDVATGQVILLTEEAEGGVIERTVEQDFNDYFALNQRERSSFDYIQLEFGQYARDFVESNGYRVNLETRQLEFSYPDPNEPEVEQPYQVSLSEKVITLEKENILLKAQNQANSDRADFHEEVLTEIILTINP